jgi:outer membrane protein
MEFNSIIVRLHIVELSQAQLQQTQAAIGDANARSQYSFAIATLQFQTVTFP